MSEQGAVSASEFSESIPVLKVNEVCKYYVFKPGLMDRLRNRPGKVLKAVDSVSFEIMPGEVVGLMGESGCGKTTLAKGICRLLDFTSGNVILQSDDITCWKGEQLRRARRRFQMLFQNPYSTLNPKMLVGDALRETLDVNFSYDREETENRIAQVLEKVALTEKRESYPTELSGGERRRVGLARLLLLEPYLIIADEPVAGLDASIKARIVDLMLEARRPDMAYLFISHDLNVIRYVADRCLIMLLGQLIEEVPASQMGGKMHHPYSHSLLDAAEKVRVRRSATDGEVDFRGLPSHKEAEAGGCPYYPRCDLAAKGGFEERCLSETPRLYEVAKGHRIACHQFDDGVR